MGKQRKETMKIITEFNVGSRAWKVEFDGSTWGNKYYLTPTKIRYVSFNASETNEEIVYTDENWTSISEKEHLLFRSKKKAQAAVDRLNKALRRSGE
jgi:hypothetical protein